MYTTSAKQGLIFTAVEKNIFKEATVNSKSSKKKLFGMSFNNNDSGNEY